MTVSLSDDLPLAIAAMTLNRVEKLLCEWHSNFNTVDASQNKVFFSVYLPADHTQSERFLLHSRQDR